MGNIIAWLVQAVRFGGPAAIGYFFNDAVSWLGKTFPSLSLTEPDGKGGTRVKWYFVVGIFMVLGLIVYLILKMISGKKKKGALLMLAIGVAYLVDRTLGEYLAVAGPEVTMATFLVTLTTGATIVTPANTQFIPKFFFYTAATQLSGVKITVQGDGVIFDSDANGLTHCGLSRLQGQVTNTYFFRIANGLIAGKTVLWEFTNSAAQTPSVYYDSDQTPPKDQRLYLQLLRQVCQGPGGTDFTDFATLSFPSMAATDYANVLYNDGTQNANMNRLDLQALMQLTQNVVNTPIYQFDNYGMIFKKVNFQAVATQTAYVQRWIAPVADGMLGQAIISKG